jgi:hypothetical protein
LCEEGELSDGVYFDAAAARCVSIDHVGAKITGTSDLEEKHRDAQVGGRFVFGTFWILMNDWCHASRLTQTNPRSRSTEFQPSKLWGSMCRLLWLAGVHLSTGNRLSKLACTRASASNSVRRTERDRRRLARWNDAPRQGIRVARVGAHGILYTARWKGTCRAFSTRNSARSMTCGLVGLCVKATLRACVRTCAGLCKKARSRSRSI